MNDNMNGDIKEAKEYLETGGLGEVIGLTDLAIQAGQPKVQMDSDMAMALCLLADEALKLRNLRIGSNVVPGPTYRGPGGSNAVG